MAKGALDIALIYSFLRRLTTPFEKWDAYESGLIDKDGKVIVKKQDRTIDQNKTWGYFDRLVANLKKLLGKIPGGKSRLASFAAALLLIKEENIDADDLDYLEETLYKYMAEAEMLVEEAPTNTAGSGQVAGIGIGPDGEPGIKKKKRKTQMLTRNYIEVGGKRKRTTKMMK
jgi:hypothetical protein